MADFFTGPGTTVLTRGELVSSIDPIAAAQSPSPRAAISSEKSATYSCSDRTGISTPSETAPATLNDGVSAESFDRAVWM